jgi:hypothetical protein
VETFVKSVSSGTDDAVEATAAVTTARATTDRLRVVAQQERARVIEPRKQAAPSPVVSQDPAAALGLLQEPEDVALGLPSRVGHPRGGSCARGCAVRGGDQSDGDGRYRTLLSKHYRSEGQSITPAAGARRGSWSGCVAVLFFLDIGEQLVDHPRRIDPHEPVERPRLSQRSPLTAAAPSRCAQ